MVELIIRCCFVVLILATFTYRQNAARPEFEVASIRVSDPENLQVNYMPTLDVRPGATLASVIVDWTRFRPRRTVTAYP
jgi:hypothetical protein